MTYVFNVAVAGNSTEVVLSDDELVAPVRVRSISVWGSSGAAWTVQVMPIAASAGDARTVGMVEYAAGRLELLDGDSYVEMDGGVLTVPVSVLVPAGMWIGVSVTNTAAVPARVGVAIYCEDDDR